MATPHPGKWKPVFQTRVVQPDCVLHTEQFAAHACVIHKPELSPFPWEILYFLAVNPEDPNDKVQTRIWNPNNPGNPPTHQDIPDWPVPDSDPPRIFCGGHVFMSNGELFIAGGIRAPGGPLTHVPHYPDTDIHGLNYTYIFNPSDDVNPWRVAGEEKGTAHAMSYDRFYPTLTLLGVRPPGFSGKVIAMSGWTVHPDLAKEQEFYDEINGWSKFPFSGAEQPFNGEFDFYPGAHLVPSGLNAGKIFYCIPMRQSYIFDPFWNGIINGGYWTPVGGLRADYRLNGTSTMLTLLPPYTAARVIISGGSPSETGYNSLAIRTAEVIDIGSANPQWTSLGNFLFFARKNHMTVVLPTDMLFVAGGNVNNYLDGPVFTAELINPTDASPLNWSSSMLPAMVYPRAHHSVSLLLPDVTVWVAGQGFTDDREELNIEIYEPGYLFEGERPTIITAPPEISYGVSFNIECSHQIAAVRLIKFGAITHSTDMSQRSIGLTFRSGTANGNFPYSITPPPNANIAPPGLYMLFVLRGESASLSGQTKIPSVARIEKLT